MYSAADLPDTVPLLPLVGALLLPRARLPLHIFEPRYLAMLDDTLKTSHRMIGMVQPVEVPDGGEPRLHQIGCAGRVTSFTETGDGRYMISLHGVSRYQITREVTGFSPYTKADVRWNDFHHDLGPAEADAGFDRAEFLGILGRFFETKGLSIDWNSLKAAEDEMLINSLSMLCPFHAEEKQALLEAPTLTARRDTLITLIGFAMHSGSDEEVMQ